MISTNIEFRGDIMQAYFAVVFVVIALSSIVIFYLFNKFKYYDSNIVVAISAGAFIISASFPIIVNLFTEVYRNLGTVYIFLAGLMTYTLLIMLCAVFINSFAEDRLNGVIKSMAKASYISNINKSIRVLNFKSVKERIYSLRNVIKDSKSPQQPENQQAGKNILEKSVDSKKIIDKMGIETIISDSVIVDNDFPINDFRDIEKQFFWDEGYFRLLSSGFEESVYAFAEDLNEYEAAEDFYEEELSYMEELSCIEEVKESIEEVNETFEEANEFTEEVNETFEEVHEFTEEVDESSEEVNEFTEKVDESIEEVKESVEESFQEVSEPNIEEYIDEAFRLKESGDLEGAILQYLYALDENPENELAFWIVLDICVMYKSLGQVELAKDILNNYYDQFGDIMEDDVKDEIERNLL